MKKKIKQAINAVICVLFIGAAFSVAINNNEKDIQSERNVIASIIYKDTDYKVSNTLQPVVVITSPPDGATVTDPHLVVLGKASDESGMNYWEYTWEWSTGSTGNSSYFDTANYVEFRIDLYGLYPGWNTVTVTFKNIYGVSGSDSVTVTYVPPDTEPPQVTITYPVEGQVFTNPDISVIGVATDNIGVTSIGSHHEWEDGETETSSTLDPPQTYYPFEWDFTLYEGWNKITIYTNDAAENYGEDSVTVTFTTDTEAPIVVIKSPEDGATFTEPDITLVGWAEDNVGIVSIGSHHEWEDGETETSSTLDPPQTYYPFEWDFTLYEGWNKITIFAEDEARNYGEGYITVWYNVTPEGLLIDTVFQPVQTVYQADPIYGDDLEGGPCEYKAKLGMVAGKNTYLFGYNYSERTEIIINVHNNYSVNKTFSFVFKIYPDDKVIWRSDSVTVPAKTLMGFRYPAPFPQDEGPFQWKSWGNNPKSKNGSIVLYLDPDVTGGEAMLPCKRVIVNVTIFYTHDLDVLFVPFTFGGGPNFPLEFASSGVTAFDEWLWLDLKPWWKAIYPVKEFGGLEASRSRTKIRKNITVDGITVSNLTTFRTLTGDQVYKLWNQLFSSAIATGWMTRCDRIVWLLHPEVLRHPIRGIGNGWAYRCPPGAMKQGVLVNWSQRTKTSAHEVSHTYGLNDSYEAGQKNKSIGYWVNKKRDVVESDNNRDLMYYTWPIWEEPGRKSWIKKPNFKILLKRFNERRDPEVLGISGFIDKNDNVRLNPWYKLDKGYVDIDWGTIGNYLVRAYNRGGNILREAGFNVSFKLCGPKEVDISETIFAFRVEWINGIYRLEIVNATSGEILATRTVTPNPPQVSILSPQPGENIQAGSYEISWDAYDPDEDVMTFHVFMSNDSGENWFPISLDLQDNSYTADFSSLGGSNCQIKVVATDGVNIGTGISGKFTILPDITSPNVEVVKPKNALYIFDKKIIPLPFTVIIGGITTEVDASDNIGIAGVDFYIDNELQYSDYNAPYEYLWDETVFCRHTINVVAYDTAGNMASDEQEVWIFNI